MTESQKYEKEIRNLQKAYNEYLIAKSNYEDIKIASLEIGIIKDDVILPKIELSKTNKDMDMRLKILIYGLTVFVNCLVVLSLFAIIHVIHHTIALFR